ncbi:MAG: hypothetical protein ABIN89_30805 [Chitinophagaceae bacterium]
MPRKRIVVLLFFTLLILSAVWVLKEYNRKVESLKNTKPDIEVTAEQLIKEFEAGDSLPSKKYSGKLIAVVGVINQVDKDDHGFFTLVLGSSNSMSSVRCAMDSVFASDIHSLQKGQATTVKGMFTGYQKDETGLLGSDIILNRCVVEMDPKNKQE